MNDQSPQETSLFRRPVPRFDSQRTNTVNDQTTIPGNPSRPIVGGVVEANGDKRGGFEEVPFSSDPYETYPLSVDDIRSQLFALGISKSKDSIQRYCREGTLTCVKLGMLRRYYATEESVAVLVETLKNDTASCNGVPLHEGADSLMQARDVGEDGAEKLHAAAADENMAENKGLHAPASNITQVHEGSDIGTKLHEALPTASVGSDEKPAKQEIAADPQMLDFLKEQLRVKDDQIKVKDEQIAAMLERDRETNILIRGLQDRIGEAFGLLVSGNRNAKDIDSPVRQDGYHQ